jgi:hypothetical protein
LYASWRTQRQSAESVDDGLLWLWLSADGEESE